MPFFIRSAAAWAIITLRSSWAAPAALRRTGKLAAWAGVGFGALIAFSYLAGTPLLFDGRVARVSLFTALALLE